MNYMYRPMKQRRVLAGWQEGINNGFSVVIVFGFISVWFQLKSKDS